MHSVATAVSCLILAAGFAVAEPVPYKIGMMSSNPAFGLSRRQAGYQPTQQYCTGSGNTCAEACGAGFATCASNDASLHCFNPTVKETCCPNLTGNSCTDGYYCTQDTTGQTWCCPNGMNLAQCAAAYTLTGSLMSQTAAPTASASDSPLGGTSTSAPATVKTTSSSSSSSTTASSAAASSTTTPVVILPTGTTSPNGTAVASAKVTLTGAANARGAAGLPALALGVLGMVVML